MDTVQIACPHCLTANRVPSARLAEDPKCGRCHQPLLPGRPVELREDQLEPFIARTALPVIVDFWAPWCGPARHAGAIDSGTLLRWAASS